MRAYCYCTIGELILSSQILCLKTTDHKQMKYDVFRIGLKYKTRNWGEQLYLIMNKQSCTFFSDREMFLKYKTHKINEWMLLEADNVVNIFQVTRQFMTNRLLEHLYWSALATAQASTSARAGAKEAINFIDTFFLPFSNHKSTNFRQPRKLKIRYAVLFQQF